MQIFPAIFKQKGINSVWSTKWFIRPIFNLCKINAKQVIKNHISKEEKYKFAFSELSKYLGNKVINKIEAYDVSHISGKNGVASCVVFTKTGSKKKNNR